MTKTTMRVASNGRAQIPYDVRMKLGIDAGDQLVVDILEVIHPGVGEIAHKDGVIEKLKKGSSEGKPTTASHPEVPA